MTQLPKGMEVPAVAEPHTPKSASSMEHNLLGDILNALQDLPFVVVVDEAHLFESDSSQSSVKLSLNLFERP